MLRHPACLLQFRSKSKDGQEDEDHEYRRTDYYQPSDRVPARQSSHLDLQVRITLHACTFAACLPVRKMVGSGRTQPPRPRFGAARVMWCPLPCYLWCILSLPLMALYRPLLPIQPPTHVCRMPTTEATMCQGTMDMQSDGSTSASDTDAGNTKAVTAASAAHHHACFCGVQLHAALWTHLLVTF